MGNRFERGPERDPHEVTCSKCFGKGRIENDKGESVQCDRCGGKGWILTQR